MTARSLATALAPVAQALLDAAHARAAALEAAVAAEAGEDERTALAEAHAVIDQARRDGEAVAERAAARTMTEARRTARERTLHAQRTALDTVRAGIRAELLRRRESGPVRSLIATLTDRARAALGAGAAIRPLTGDRLGVVADDGNRHLELELDDLVDRELEQQAERVREVWA